MKILFLCTSYNSLSQSLYLALSTQHDITIEYALSDQVMIEAVELAKPDLILCPFLTCKVPQEIYTKILTLIIHPGPPGDAGPSALDWVLMGDTGEIESADQVLQTLDHGEMQAGRSHWGVTVLQAIEQFDAGPVWAFEQFPINIDQPELTKSDVYRGPVTQAAIKASIAAIDRVHRAMIKTLSPETSSAKLPGFSIKQQPAAISPNLKASPSYRLLSVSTLATFQGGKTRHRPLLPAKKRDFDPSRHTAQQISRRIRCGDSQPGVLSKVFGQALYIYGGIIEEGFGVAHPIASPGSIVAARNEAVCIATCDGRGIWITNIRRPKRNVDKALWPKVPAVMGLMELGILDAIKAQGLEWATSRDWSLSPTSTFQEVWLDFVPGANGRTAYLYFNFYNGAMTTKQCSQLIEAMDYILASSTEHTPVNALVMMGGNYFSNGIALNVIEAEASPAASGWMNINRIDDVVQYLLQEMPRRNILTIAGIRGNAAAGGVAFAAACDIVVAGANVVLNPAYRSMGLHGSEYHSLSYFGRCGHQVGTQLLREMLPISAFQALACGLVDHVVPGQGPALDAQIRAHVSSIVDSACINIMTWKRGIDLSPEVLAAARVTELAEMSKDFFSLRAQRFHTRRFAFIRKCKSSRTPFRFAKHRRFPVGADRQLGLGELDEEERDDFDDVKTLEWFLEKEREKMWSAHVKSLPRSNSMGGSTLADGDRAVGSDLGSENGSEKNISIVQKTATEKTWVKALEKESPVVEVSKDYTPIFSCYYTPPLEASMA